MNKNNGLKRFIKQTRGAIAVMTALFIPIMVGFLTISIEISRQNYVESMLSFAVDAAAIAGARYDVTQYQQNAQRIFDANFPPGTMGISPVLTVEYNAQKNTVHTSVNAQMPTKIGPLMGINHLTVKAESVVNREFGGLELVMVLDTTGSMSSNSKINGLRTAAKSLIDVIYEGANTRENTAIGVVPFVTTVNIGPNNTSWLSDPSTINSFPVDKPWEGCVKTNSMAENGDELFDTPPPTNKWPVYYAESTIPNPDDCVKRDNDWHVTTKLGIARKCPPKALPSGTPVFEVWTAVSGVNVGPNRSCSLPIMPMINNATQLKTYIDTLQPVNGGGTMGNLGIVWGGRLISEAWSGLWSVEQPSGTVVTGVPSKLYTEPTNTKAMLIMTDGESNWYNGPEIPNSDPTAYGSGATDRYVVGKLGSTSISNFQTKIDQKITRLCTALKARGIEVYTVTFRVTSTAVNNIYKNCATTPDHFAAASDNAALLNVFNSIGKQLKRIRITA